MLQGRNNRFSFKNKSKLIINRQTISNQRPQTTYDSPFLYIKHIEIQHEGRVSPFHIRKVPSVDKRQLLSKRQNSKQKFLKPKVFESVKLQNHSASKEQKFLAQEENIECLNNIDNQIDNLIATLNRLDILKAQDNIFVTTKINLKLLLKTMIEDQLFVQVKIKNIIKKLTLKQIQSPSITKIIQQKHHKINCMQIHSAFTLNQLFHIHKPTKRESSRLAKQTNLVQLAEKDKKQNNQDKENIKSIQDKEIPQNTFNQHNQSKFIKLTVQQDTKQLDLKQGKTTVNCNEVITDPISQQDILSSQESSIQLEQTDCQKFLNNFDETEFEEFKEAHCLLLLNYVEVQPNKIIQRALFDHKAIEQQMLGYVDMLNISKYGVKTYISDVNISALDNLIDGQLKKTNKYIIQGQDSLIQKCRYMRDFITTTRQRYDKLLKEMMTVIDKKTQFCRQFVTKVHKWGSNYFLRKEYLQSLKKDYCQDLFFFYIKIKKVFLKLGRKRQKNREAILQLEDALKKIKKMDELILIGNNFY